MRGNYNLPSLDQAQEDKALEIAVSFYEPHLSTSTQMAVSTLLVTCPKTLTYPRSEEVETKVEIGSLHSRDSTAINF